MFTDKTDLTLNSTFSGEFNLSLLPRSTRDFLLYESKSANLSNKPHFESINLTSEDNIRQNNISYDDYVRYVNNCEDKAYLICIRCGKKVYPLDDDYDSNLIKYEEPDFLCSNCNYSLNQSNDDHEFVDKDVRLD